jgi:hypothetical protein
MRGGFYKPRGKTLPQVLFGGGHSNQSLVARQTTSVLKAVVIAFKIEGNPVDTAVVDCRMS